MIDASLQTPKADASVNIPLPVESRRDQRRFSFPLSKRLPSRWLPYSLGDLLRRNCRGESTLPPPAENQVALRIFSDFLTPAMTGPDAPSVHGDPGGDSRQMKRKSRVQKDIRQHAGSVFGTKGRARRCGILSQRRIVMIRDGRFARGCGPCEGPTMRSATRAQRNCLDMPCPCAHRLQPSPTLELSASL